MVYVDIGMHIKVWIYAIRAILLVIGCFNVPELVIGKKTNFKFSFWVFAVHTGLIHTYQHLYAIMWME